MRCMSVVIVATELMREESGPQTSMASPSLLALRSRLADPLCLRRSWWRPAIDAKSFLTFAGQEPAKPYQALLLRSGFARVEQTHGKRVVSADA